MTKKLKLNPPATIALILLLSLVFLAVARDREHANHIKTFGELPDPETCIEMEAVDVVFLNMNSHRAINAQELEASRYLLKSFELETGVFRNKIKMMSGTKGACDVIEGLDSLGALYVVSEDNFISTNISDLQLDKKRCKERSREGLRFNVPLFVHSESHKIYLHKTLDLGRNEIRNLYEPNEIQYRLNLTPRCFISYHTNRSEK